MTYNPDNPADTQPGARHPEPGNPYAPPDLTPPPGTQYNPSGGWDDNWFGVEKPDPVTLLTNGDAMRDYIIRRSRLPFQEVLARLLGAEPDPESVKAFARANPDKWSTMIKNMSNLAGYKDGIEIEANLSVAVHEMGDGQLIQQFRELTNKIAHIEGEVAQAEDGEFEEVPAHAPGTPAASLMQEQAEATRRQMEQDQQTPDGSDDPVDPPGGHPDSAQPSSLPGDDDWLS